jgi:3-oxoacyl-[acyl-carrier-protein] synthase-1
VEPLHLSHFAIVSGLGAGLDATLGALQAGRSGLRPQSYRGAVDTWTGKIDALDTSRLDESLAPFECRNNRLAALALAQDNFVEAVEALRDKYGPDRIGVFLGTSASGIEQTELAYRRRDAETGRLPADFRYGETHNTFSVGKFVGRVLRLAGPVMVVSAACATSAKAFGSAARMIGAGLCDAAIVGGVDALCSTTIYGFHSLGLMSPTPCRPFDAARDGISIGEASGFATVEKATGARLPSDAILLRGFGESSDAYHMSAPHPEGIGARLAMERALASAGLTPKDIDYINLHGTATLVGDAAEDRALVSLFGRETPCSSTKGHTGHTLGAAGIVEVIISSLAIRNGFMPCNANTQEIDPALCSHYLTINRQASVARVLSNSFGFGGSNCSLVLERAS